MRPDADILREMIQEANEQATATQAMAELCWALDQDERAEAHVADCATQQARARVLSSYLTTLSPEPAHGSPRGETDRLSGRPTLHLVRSPA